MRGKTLGEVARDAGAPLHRVAYIVRARGIRHDWRVGKLRVFGPETEARIVAELKGGRECSST
jgi:hypothetical protein